jgi:hypothetical protein
MHIFVSARGSLCGISVGNLGVNPHFETVFCVAALPLDIYFRVADHREGGQTGQYKCVYRDQSRGVWSGLPATRG